MSRIFLTSDTHFGHTNIVQYDKTPWDTLEGLEEGIIQRWNEVVRPEDSVLHVGDFSFRGADYTRDRLIQLNGKITLIRGNHDRNSYRSIGFHDFMTSTILDTKRGLVVVAHKPALCVQEARKNGIGMALCGHVHQMFVRSSVLGVQLVNVGCPAHNYYPVELSQLLDMFDIPAEGEFSEEDYERARGGRA